MSFVPQYINTTSASTTTTTTSGSLQVPGLYTSSLSYSRIDTNNVVGDVNSTAWSKANYNFAGLAAVVNAGGPGNINTTDLIVTHSLTIVDTSSIIAWTLDQITLTGGNSCENGLYTLDTNSLDSNYNMLVNPACGLTYEPMTVTDLSQLSASFDQDANNYLINSGLSNYPTSYSLWMKVNQAILDMKSTDTWNCMDAVYFFAAGTAAGNSINAISNSLHYTIDWHYYMATPSAHGDFGVRNDNSIVSGSTAPYGDTHYDPTLNGTASNISIGCWVDEPYVLSYPMGQQFLQIVVGGFTSGPPAGNGVYGFANSTPTQNTASGITFTSGSGTIITSRSSSISQSSMINGNFFSFSSSVATNSGSVYIGTVNEGTFALNVSASVGFAFIGRGLNKEKMVSLQGIIENFNSFRPTSSYNNYYYQLPGIGGSPTNSTPSASINAFFLWKPTSCGWTLEGQNPLCGFGGPCYGTGNTLVKCSGSGHIYVVPNAQTASICGFCFTR